MVITGWILLKFLLISTILMNLINAYAIPSDDLQPSQLKEIYVEFLNWWINVPSTIGGGEPVKDCIHNVEGNYIFLMDPYGKKKIIASCEFPSGHSIVVPFFHGWCDNGNQASPPVYGTLDIQKLKECVGPVNKGQYTITAELDNKEMANVVIEINQDTSWKFIPEKFPPPVLKVIDVQNDLFNITLKSSTRYSDSYFNVTDFSKAPKTYQGIGICICGIFDSSLLTLGDHTLHYHILSAKTQSPLPTADATYSIKIK